MAKIMRYAYLVFLTAVLCAGYVPLQWWLDSVPELRLPIFVSLLVLSISVSALLAYSHAKCRNRLAALVAGGLSLIAFAVLFPLAVYGCTVLLAGGISLPHPGNSGMQLTQIDSDLFSCTLIPMLPSLLITAIAVVILAITTPRWLPGWRG